MLRLCVFAAVVASAAGGAWQRLPSSLRAAAANPESATHLVEEAAVDDGGAAGGPWTRTIRRLVNSAAAAPSVVAAAVEEAEAVEVATVTALLPRGAPDQTAAASGGAWSSIVRRSKIVRRAVAVKPAAAAAVEAVSGNADVPSAAEGLLWPRAPFPPPATAVKTSAAPRRFGRGPPAVSSAPIEAIEVIGSSVLPPSVMAEAAQKAGIGGGASYDLDAAQAFAAELNDWFRRSGYLFTRITTIDAPVGGRLTLQAEEPLVCNEPVGLEFYTQKKHGEGENATYTTERTEKSRTRPSTVTQALGLKSGEPFKWDQQNFARLQRSGLFKDLKVAEVKRREDGVQVLLAVSEGPFTTFEPGISTSLGKGRVVADVTFKDRNLLGRNHQLSLQGSVNPTMALPEVRACFENNRFGRCGGFVVDVFQKKRSVRKVKPEKEEAAAAAKEEEEEIGTKDEAGDTMQSTTVDMAVDDAVDVEAPQEIEVDKVTEAAAAEAAAAELAAQVYRRGLKAKVRFPTHSWWSSSVGSTIEAANCQRGALGLPELNAALNCESTMTFQAGGGAASASGDASSMSATLRVSMDASAGAVKPAGAPRPYGNLLGTGKGTLQIGALLKGVLPARLVIVGRGVAQGADVPSYDKHSLAVRGANGALFFGAPCWADTSIELQVDLAQGITAAAFADGGLSSATARQPELSCGVGVHYGPLKCELVRHRGERKVQFGMVGFP